MGPDSVSAENLKKMGGKVMIPYRARLLEVTINNATIPSDWKRALMVPIYKVRVRKVVTNYRPVSLTSVICKQGERAIA